MEAATNLPVLQGASANSVSLYRRLIHDSRISHGAFRLWHYLRDRKNKNGQTWPEVRTIAAEIHCKPHSVCKWVKELSAAEYISVEPIGHNHYHRYTILNGDAVGVAMPKWATPRVSGDAQIGNAKIYSHCPNGSTALPKGNTPRDAQMGNVSNTQVVSSISKGNTVSITGAERISYEKELEAIAVQRKETKNGAIQVATGFQFTPEERAKLKRMKERETELKKLLGREF